MNDLHQRFAEWLAGGAEGDPPRDVALHASGCEACLAAAAALDSLRAIDVGAAPMPPRGVIASDNPLTGWRMARVGAGAAAVVVLAAVAVIGSSSLGDRAQPDASTGGRATSGGGVLAGVPSSTPFATTSRTPTPAPTRSATPTDRPEPTSAPTPAPTVRPPARTPAPAPATPVPTPAPPTASPAPTQPPPTSPPPTATPLPTPTPTDVPTPSPTPLPTPAPDDCADGIDNDGDSLIDAADPGCSTPSANEDAA